MPRNIRKVRVLKSMGAALAVTAWALIPVALVAQSGSTSKGTSNESSSRWDIFAGYSYLAPKGTVQVPQASGATTPYSYNAVNVGGLFSGAYYFNRWIGAQVEFAEHEWGSGQSGTNNGTHGNDDGFLTLGGGLIARYPTGNITPFVHGLVNADRVEGPFHNGPKWGPGLTAGGGLDYELPWLNHRFAFRLFQADYEYMYAYFGPQASPPGGHANINAARLSTGIVIHAGSIAPPPPVTLACSASPTSVFPGEPITVTATAGNLNPKENVIYGWTGNGVTGNGTSATVATANLAPGSYTAQANVKTGKKGKEGLKPWQSASCSASNTVKEFEPPTISCTANPTTIQPNGTSTITCQGVSPQNRPLTYSYEASAGSVSGSGNTANFSAAGAPTGAVEVTCNVSDDKEHTANTQTLLTITAPTVPPVPRTGALCSISFSRDKKRPTRVDNEAKACLDQVALDLKQQPEAKAVVVGEQTSDEAAKTEKQQAYAAKRKRGKVDQYAAQRAVNVKDYLVTEQGIDASRIRVATGATEGPTVENYLVPSGATFTNDVNGTTLVDETAVMPQARKPLPQRDHTKRRTSN